MFAAPNHFSRRSASICRSSADICSIATMSRVWIVRGAPLSSERPAGVAAICTRRLSVVSALRRDEATIDQPAHDDRYGALVRRGALSEVVQRCRRAMRHLLQHEQLRETIPISSSIARVLMRSARTTARIASIGFVKYLRPASGRP